MLGITIACFGMEVEAIKYALNQLPYLMLAYRNSDATWPRQSSVKSILGSEAKAWVG